MAVTDHHKLVRDAIAAALREAVVGVDVHAVDSIDDVRALGQPCVAVCCVGPEQNRPELGTNVHNGRGFAVAVALFAAGVPNGERSDGVPDATLFRRTVDVTFDQKRLSGVTQICWCEVSGNGQIWDRREPCFQALLTELLVTAVGRFPRS